MLTLKEFELLELLIRNKNIVLSKGLAVGRSVGI